MANEHLVVNSQAQHRQPFADILRGLVSLASRIGSNRLEPAPAEPHFGSPMQRTSPDELKEKFYPESTFGGFSDVDGTVAFYSRVNALARPHSVVVDFGCGRGSYAEDHVIFRRNLTCLKGRVARVIGVDIDTVGLENPALDEFRQLTPGSEWPVESNSADIILCDWVMEHLPEPDPFFREAKRVLAQRGYLCIRTLNSRSYVGLASQFVPNKYHDRILSKTQRNRKPEDIFPTLYRCNTISALRRKMSSHGFNAVVYGHEAEPSYLLFSKLAYCMGVLHQRFAPGFLRPSIFGFGQSI
jgi:SAM-dependent methyltransferase